MTLSFGAIIAIAGLVTFLLGYIAGILPGMTLQASLTKWVLDLRKGANDGD